LVTKKWLWYTTGVSSFSGWSLLFKLNWLNTAMVVGMGAQLGLML
jgi:hypothetical protein